MDMNSKFKLGLIIGILSLLTGCASAPKVEPGEGGFAPTMPVEPSQQRYVNGSIFLSGGAAVPLLADPRPKRIGDILTVRLEEETKSSKDANTTFAKDSSTSLPNPTLFGSFAEFNMPGIIPLNSNKNNNLSMSLDMKRAFDGKNGAVQNNSLSGEITVTVADVLSNGNLVIKGEKWLTLNQGDEFIRISGIVNPNDISPNNVVVSTRIADAKITYSATGDLANAHKMGWFSKMLNSSWWPF
jgi:flagellar L-ring protein precursor FlgH